MLGKWPSVFGPLLCNCISVMLRSHLHRQKIPLIQYLFQIPKLLGTWVVDFFFLSEPESGCRFYSTRITRSSFVNLWGSISDVVLRWMSCHKITLLYDIVCTWVPASYTSGYQLYQPIEHADPHKWSKMINILHIIFISAIIIETFFSL